MLLIDGLGYASLLGMFLLNNWLRQGCEDYQAAGIALIAWLPFAAAWHHYRARFSEPA